MSDSWKDCEGQVVDGQFQLLQHLGGSDHSVVFSTQRGEDKREKAAIKFIQADAPNAQAQLSRWKDTAQFSHPNLITLFESGRCQLAGMDLLYVVMEFAHENLAQFLPHRPLSAEETHDMLEPFIDTLTYLHGKGFVHGRIKPGNILAIDDQLKLSSDSVCRSGEAQIGAGKPDVYTAPECVSETSTPAGDVWSLGVTLVESLTQQVPEQNEEDQLVVADSLPPLFLDIATHSLRNDPKSRWTIAEISTRLNPPAKPIAAAASASGGANATATAFASAGSAAAVGVADPVMPAAARIPAGISASALSAASAAAPARSVAYIDPLCVPLSTVAPLTAAAQGTLNYQRKGSGIAPRRSPYVILTVLVALTVGAVLAFPGLRARLSELYASAVASLPAVQPDTASPAAAQSAPAAAASALQPTTPETVAQSQPQLPANQTPKNESNDSMATAGQKQYINKDGSSSVGSTAAATPIAVSPLAPAHRNPVTASSNVVPTAPPGSVSQGAVLNEVLPAVTARSRRTIQGTVRVIVKVHVDASGNVTGAVPAAASSKFFGDAAVQAVKRWDFSPAKVAGEPAASEWLVRFDITQNDIKVLPAQTKP
jgi:TonB family protein